MTLRTKALAGTSAFLCALFAVLYIAARFVLLASFERLELDNSRANVALVQTALADELDQMDSIVLSNSAWSQTYDYARSRDAAWADAELDDGTGPPRGAVVVVRYVDAVERQRLARTTHLTLTVAPADPAARPGVALQPAATLTDASVAAASAASSPR